MQEGFKNKKDTLDSKQEKLKARLVQEQKGGSEGGIVIKEGDQ